MTSITVKVGSSVGLHARPAQIISEKAEELGVPVTLSVPGGEPVDADSSLLIMTLGASHGDEVVVSSDDADAAETIAALVVLDLDDPAYEA
ncbi:MAG TPA: HPr family phosphocarrier protein [Intrasporangium sp.]|uniref:HPr family phosphocarrier protein n=1 Tax=Intrasporangium sp. TaxID=1925024 RepID=UPI002D77D715|nr:HPr family phosphocarrier protein [Intrasporangium sp.]HET7398098.1 HPr family phosphocarrier protein [Intrasporangium sp.]